jgi:hypothetical protein
MHPEHSVILDEARRQIANGVEPDRVSLERRIHAVEDGDTERALAQLGRLLAVHRARRSLLAPPPAQPAAAQRRSTPYRARPTIAANIAVRARANGDNVILEWDAVPGVASWEARLSERPDARSDYVERETAALDATRLELTLGEQPQRIHLLGRNVQGRLVKRALISGLTSGNWRQRWQQRASAA